MSDFTLGLLLLPINLVYIPNVCEHASTLLTNPTQNNIIRINPNLPKTDSSPPPPAMQLYKAPNGKT